MKKFLIISALVFISYSPCFGEVPPINPALVDEKTCDKLIEKAETTQEGSIDVYALCGFDDPQKAWGKWAGTASAKNWKKALYELCVRYPDHTYGPLYCDKSAALGYGPALAEIGHRQMRSGNTKSALNSYATALATKELSKPEEGKIAEYLGFYYLTPDSPDFNVPKALAFLSKAALQRSARSNNMLGYLAYSGKYGIKVDQKEALKYFWRAILLDCPAAEENLGLFHLSRQNKISKELALEQMEKAIFTCDPSAQPQKQQIDASLKNCPCQTVLETEQRFRSKPYILLETGMDTAVLEDSAGNKIHVKKGTSLQDGGSITEIRKTAVIGMIGKERIILNLYKKDPCLSYCQENNITTNPSQEQKDNQEQEQQITIKPYRLSFTPQECRDLTYYAPLLVDTALPYVGKEQCAFSGTTDDPLLQMMQDPDDQVETTLQLEDSEPEKSTEQVTSEPTPSVSEEAPQNQIQKPKKNLKQKSEQKKSTKKKTTQKKSTKKSSSSKSSSGKKLENNEPAPVRPVRRGPVFAM